ncbi:MAG: DUF6428 family protein [Pseudomonadota bacterium]
MTLNDLLAALDPLDPAAPLIFATDDGAIAGGYHVTEFKFAHIESIDCGGHRHRFDEAILQLLDGRGGARMAAGKFAAIARRSAKAVVGLGEAPLKVEFAHGNAGKVIYEIAAPEVVPTGIRVGLRGDAAACKPAVAARALAPSGCGTSAASCC